MADASASSSSSDAQLYIHPMVLINISDHHLRHSHAAPSAPAGAGSSSHATPCIGMLFGVQKGMRSEIFTSFEAKVDGSAGSSYTVDAAFVEEQINLVTAVFPTYDLLGWYAAAEQATPLHLYLHRQFTKFNEAPFFLLLSPGAIAPGSKELPVAAHQAEYHGSSMIFSPVPFKLDATESERITIDHISSEAEAHKGGSGGDSARAQQLRSTASALKVLAERLDVLQTFVQCCQNGQIQLTGPARPLLRDISSLCARLGVGLGSPQLALQMQRDTEDSLLLAYAASLVKGAQSLDSVVEKLAVVQPREGRGGDREREWESGFGVMGGGVGSRDQTRVPLSRTGSTGGNGAAGAGGGRFGRDKRGEKDRDDGGGSTFSNFMGAMGAALVGRSAADVDSGRRRRGPGPGAP